ncbi:MAG: hypothetical protein QXX08_11065 [Candidatus Bathyarchaeia archaeon]
MTKNVKPRLSVFKGREAKLNKAIFWILAQEGPLTTYDITRKVRAQKELRYIKYSVINRRVRHLEQKGYIEKIGLRRTRAGFEARLYQLTFRAYLSIILNQTDLDYYIETAKEEKIICALSSLILIDM